MAHLATNSPTIHRNNISREVMPHKARTIRNINGTPTRLTRLKTKATVNNKLHMAKRHLQSSAQMANPSTANEAWEKPHSAQLAEECWVIRWADMVSWEPLAEQSRRI